MKKAILVGIICFATSLAFTATENQPPLNAKTGLWQITETVTWSGLPPQYAGMLGNGRPRSYKPCVKSKDLSSNPWAEGSGEKCSWTVLKSTGADMEVKGNACDIGREYGMTSEVHGTIHVSDRETGTGSFDVTLTGNGQTMKGHASYTGKWLAATCPADVN
jgi:Protein of unknown function (DUF3617)